MPKTRNALIRIHTIDACLRRRNRLWTIDDLVEACVDALYEYEGISEISTRTIRRDLQLMRSEKLGYNAPIIVKDKKYYTYAEPDYSITNLPLSKKDLNELSSALDIIRHYGSFNGMSGQEDIITRMQDTLQCQQSQTRVVYLETNQQLKGLRFLGVLYDFIIRKVPLAVRYRSFKSEREIVQHVSPYILKEFNNRWFLFGYSQFAHGVRVLALDRIVEVEEDTENPYIENTFFEPESFFEEMVGVTRGTKDQRQNITIKVDKETAPYIVTKPLHSSQEVIEEYEDGSVMFSLYVIHNLELERLLLGFGCHLEVVSPRLLRHRMAKNIAEANKIYQNVSSGSAADAES